MQQEKHTAYLNQSQPSTDLEIPFEAPRKLRQYVIKKKPLVHTLKEGRISLKLLQAKTYRGYWEVKNAMRIKHGKTGGGIKKEIRCFSNHSKRNYLKAFGRIPEESLPTWWQDLTFADDVMQYKTLKERAVFCTETIHRFRKRFKRRFPGSYLLWKREWQPRKSGSLEGEYCPHIHALIHFHGDEEAPARASAYELAHMWVECTKTTETAKALKVATNENSYREIRSTTAARRYAVAYAGKQDHQLFTESPGRFWGVCGKLPQEAGEEIELSLHDEIWLRRIARRMVSKKKRSFRKQLAKPGTSTFFMMERYTLNKLLSWIRTVPDLDKTIQKEGGSNLDKAENNYNEGRNSGQDF